MTDRSLEDLLEFLRRDRGFDFTGYKRPSLERRIRHRMTEVGIDSLDDYHDFLEVHPDEFNALFNTILVNVTGFFRDPTAWESLERDVIPLILAAKPAGEPIRVWSAGCASGEEAYSLAIVFAETLGSDEFRRRVKIYGTDIDDDAIARARRGEYTAKEMGGVSAERAAKYFENLSSTRRVFRPDLRRCVVFGRHDLTSDTPITRVDLLVCRNSLIYLNTETQSEVVARFHFALAPLGFLFLGKSEALVRYNDLFTPVDMRYRIFRKVATRGRMLPLPAPSGGAHRFTAPVAAYPAADLAEEVVAEALVDGEGRLAAANPACRLLFQVGPDDLGRPVDEVELFRAPVDLRPAVLDALGEGRSFVARDVFWGTPPDALRRFDVRVAPLGEGERPAPVSVLFVDVTATRSLEREAHESKENLATAMEELQSANEELETTNEELQSTNEELETTNEELQSTNEELETMNEELQSASEQFDTMNRELRSRTAALNEANQYLEAVVGSLLVSVVVLDLRLLVISWNRAAEQLWGLWSAEVVGRSFFSLDIGLPVERLRAPLVACLEGRSEREDLVVPATNRRGREIRCRVSITPLAGPDGAATGVVVVMEEAHTLA